VVYLVIGDPEVIIVSVVEDFRDNTIVTGAGVSSCDRQQQQQQPPSILSLTDCLVHMAENAMLRDILVRVEIRVSTDEHTAIFQRMLDTARERVPDMSWDIIIV
jgi:hypothetical protein